MSKISDHISYAEATRSNTAKRKSINNSPEQDHLDRMKKVAEEIFEPLRAWATEKRGENTPIGISSFYRSTTLNSAIGGSRTSQHCTGEAIDIDIDGMYQDLTNADLFNWIKDNCDFDQLIWEYGNDSTPSWVHVSYDYEGKNRNIKLKCYKEQGATKYINI